MFHQINSVWHARKIVNTNISYSIVMLLLNCMQEKKISGVLFVCNSKSSRAPITNMNIKFYGLNTLFIKI